MSIVNRESSIRRTFPTAEAFEAAWRAPISASGGEEGAANVASLVGAALARDGFRVFHNGGLPLVDRRHGQIRSEIVFPTQPHGDDLAVRFHLTHEGVGEVRAKFWQPAIRAPKTVASGDVGLLESEPVYSLWSSKSPKRTAEAVVELLTERVLPWFDLVDDPPQLRDALIAGDVPMIDLTTSVELMIAEFGPREARRYLRSVAELAWPPLVVPKPNGFALDDSRMATLVAYYQL